MSITPIHIFQQGHDVALVSGMMTAHLFAMFASSPFSGWLCNRVGISATIMAGLVLMLSVTGLNVLSSSAYVSCLSLFMLGLAWNILFVSGATLLVKAVPYPDYSPSAQGLGEFVTASCTAISCFIGGAALNDIGWKWINYGAVGMMILFVATRLWRNLEYFPGHFD
ncbi:MFS transporter [Bombella sp. TMW 2.2559]|uniref:MFS transporter n=1 Tax=Bombella dulcis TaxID=2967339 RepID=A0ABT3WB76_9PROT|nr:MFS transporter [Bombella dulcis]MCX5615604.1 MFS transporter [Bombella dulcis]